MEMFNTHRRDILNFDNYMDLKKPGFGGPNSAIAQRDAKGNKINKDPKLAGYTRVVDRHPAFSHPVADPTYKAMTHDLVYKQEKKKPFTYNTATGIPVVEVGEVEETNEGFAHKSFSSFINENDSEIEQLRAELEAYEAENGVDDEDVSAGANPLDEEPSEDIKRWLETIGGSEEAPDAMGSNPSLDGSEEEYYGEEYDEPLTSPEEDPLYEPNN